MDLVCGSVDLISLRISSMAFEMKVCSGRKLRRVDFIRSSRVRWKRLSMMEVEEDID